jgi:hypothetical protein
MTFNLINFRCLLEWYRVEVLNENTLKLVKVLLSKGAKTNSWRLIRRLLLEDQVTKSDFKIMVDALKMDWWGELFNTVVDLLFDDFKAKRKPIFSKKQILLILEWKYGDSSGLIRSLPREILQLIISYLNKPPLYYRYACMVVEKYTIQYQKKMVFDSTTKKDPLFAKLVSLHPDKIDP